MTLSCEIDHVLIGCPSLDDANLWFESSTGVKPQHGGSHPDRGTCNALVSLTGKTYLELIAPDATQSARSVARNESEKLTAPAFCWWALRTIDLPGTRDVLVSRGVTCSDVLHGSRMTLDGLTLNWKLLMTTDDDLGCQLPFFISWENEDQHPGAQAPAGSIEALTFCGPHAGRLEEILNAVGLNAGTIQCTTGATSQQHLDLLLGGAIHTIQGADALLPSFN
ncbi:MAG: VOC family protein [Chromatocurvus sp.]